MHRVLLTLGLGVLVALSGCDSSDDTGGLDDCALIGTQNLGTITATTPNGSLQTSCALITSSSGFLVINVRTPGSASPLGADAIEILLDGPRVGVYELGVEDAEATASYGRTPASVIEAASGTVEVTSLSGGIEARFSFTTVTGQEVTNGRLDLNF